MAPMITRNESEDPRPQTPIKIPLGEYLFLRICQANPKLRSIFGIPGDFNLPLLEHIYSDSVSAKAEFVGFCNELNAAYAADGYAKVMESLSVLITTFGVGELSALNGIAGAFAEYAPVLHIVGTTSIKQIDQALDANPSSVRNYHHLIQNKDALTAPDHDVYKRAASGFSVVQESLGRDLVDNLDKIDQVLVTVLQESRPGYLFVPSDVSDLLVPASRLHEPLALSELNDEALLVDMTQRILAKLYAAEKPSIIGDALINRFGGKWALDRFIAALPTNFVKLFTSAFGRNIDETLPNFIGVYSGKTSSSEDVIEAVEKETDFLLSLGYINNEINTGGYSINLSQVSDYVEVHPDYIFIDGEYVRIKSPETGKRSFSIIDLVSRLASEFKASRLVNNDGKTTIKRQSPLKIFGADDEVPVETLTQNKLTDFFNSYLRPHDILMVETCTFQFAISDLRLPKGVKVHSQNFYGSIGFALPATFGASRAERDLGTNRRVLLVQGDGSAQMTAQELSTFLRYEIQAPEIFLLNNSGYTVERLIQGPTRPYNDIQDTWKWTNLLKDFGDEENEKHEAEKINTTSELQALIGRKSNSKIHFYELKLAKLDAPQRFKNLYTSKGKRSD